MSWTLVTGAAKGLGREIALHLAKEGKHILIHYRTSQKEAESLKLELQALGVKAEVVAGDFSSIDRIHQFTKQLKNFSIEGLVNNVGNYAQGSAATTSPEIALELYHTNVLAPLMIAQALLPSLKENHGSIVNIGITGCSTVSANVHRTLYTTTKTTLYQLTRSLAKELGPDGVNVNMVSPGYLENSVDLPPTLEHIPMGRLGKLSEAAQVVVFLMHPHNRYITGQNIEVAGGLF
jgi:NAD(P)-dependent dehydrogenase (short-subunit alcohol dehydrogenase family)